MEQPNNNQQKNGLANVMWLGLSSFLNDLSSEMILPILPLIITNVGGTGLALGLIGGLRDSAAEVLKAIFGKLSDKKGERKTFIYAGYLTSSLFKLALLVARSWQLIFILVGLERLGKAIRTAPRDALITQTMPHNIGRGFGIHRTFDTLGAIAGSLLVFYLVWQWNYGTFGIIAIAATLSLISVLPLAKVTEAPNGQHHEPEIVASDGQKTFSPAFIRFTCIAAFFSLARVSYMFFLVHAQAVLGGSAPLRTSMLLYVLFNIFYTMGAIPFGILSDAIGRWTMIIIGYLCFSGTLFGFAFATSLPMLIGCFVLYGISLAIIQVTHKAFAADLGAENVKATVLGTFESVTGVAIFVSGIGAGLLWEVMGHPLIFAGAGAIALIAVMLMVFWKSSLTHLDA